MGLTTSAAAFICVVAAVALVPTTSRTSSPGTANPIAFGARGDDATDDGPAIQRAIDALPPGGTLILTPPRKKYAVATEVIITKPVAITADGWDTVVRADSDRMAAVFRVQGDGDGTVFSNFRLEGSKSRKGGVPQRAIHFNGATDGLVRSVVISGPAPGTGFNFGVVITGAHSNRTRVLDSRIERLVSSSGNGTAVLIEASSFNRVSGNVIHGSEFNNADRAPGAAIFLSAYAGGDGSADNVVSGNLISDHRQAGIAVNSITYFEFAGRLGACDRNVIANNEVRNCRSANGGDASSGIVIVGNSSSNRVLNNKVHHNGDAAAGGYGILISGAQRGAAAPGEPKLDETPDRNEVAGNHVYDNQDDGVRIKGAANTSVVGNLICDNGQRTAAVFSNVFVDGVGASATANGTTIAGNNLMGSRLAYQIGIGPSAVNTKVEKNFYMGGANGVVNDTGARSIHRVERAAAEQDNRVGVHRFAEPNDNACPCSDVQALTAGARRSFSQPLREALAYVPVNRPGTAPVRHLNSRS